MKKNEVNAAVAAALEGLNTNLVANGNREAYELPWAVGDEIRIALEEGKTWNDITTITNWTSSTGRTGMTENVHTVDGRTFDCGQLFSVANGLGLTGTVNEMREELVRRIIICNGLYVIRIAGKRTRNFGRFEREFFNFVPVTTLPDVEEDDNA